MRRLVVLILASMLVFLTSCNNFREIKVNNAKLENVTPYGMRGVDLELSVEIDNPALQIKITDMEATIKYSGKVLGNVTVDPFTMKGKRVEEYDVKARMILDQGVMLYDLLMLLDKKFTENCLVDITVTGKLRGGLSKTITRKDVPLKKLMKYAEKNK